VTRSNHNKTEKNRRKLFNGGDIISVLIPPSRNKSLHIHVKKDVDAKVVTLIFNGAVIEKTIPSFPFTVVGEEKEEEIKL
jgi:hypothetical protein